MHLLIHRKIYVGMRSATVKKYIVHLVTHNKEICSPDREDKEKIPWVF